MADIRRGVKLTTSKKLIFAAQRKEK